MGFYGNITNNVKTNLQFDRKYPNRYSMEYNQDKDGVYAGRYVLVEYDFSWEETGIKNDTIPMFYRYDEKNYIGPSNTNPELIPVEGKIYRAVDLKPHVIAPDETVLTEYYTNEYYIGDKDEKNKPILRLVSNSESIYVTNFNIDNAYYGDGKGYDSTVWQKTYDNDGIAKYVNVAELNAIIPTFGLKIDAPGQKPVAPHFGQHNTNVYYDLHLSPAWGFRVKQAENSNLSDAQTIHDNTPVNAAIFYNKAGFDPYTKHKVEGVVDEIKITTDASGYEYNIGEVYGDNRKAALDDIQELTINLPSIGNMMSDVWDIVHGPNRKDAQTDENSSLQGRLNSFTALARNTIPIKRNSDGTIVGTKINGDSNRTVPDQGILEETLSKSPDQDDAWIYTKVDSLNENAIAIHHTFHSKKDTSSASNVNGKGDTIKLYSPIVDAAGHVVGKNIETVTLPYGYKTITTNGRSDEIAENETGTPVTNNIVADSTQDVLAINSGNKWIRIDTDANVDSLTIRHDVHSITTNDKAATNLNNGIDTITIQDTIYDEAGHVTANQKHTYTLPYGYKTITTNGRVAEDIATNNNGTIAATQTVANNTQDTVALNSGNYWTRIDIVDDKITLSHTVRDINTAKKDSTNLNKESGAEEENNINIPEFTYDAAGHITSKQDHKYTLPFGFKTIKATNSTSVSEPSTGVSNNIVADQTQDTLDIAASNKWIKLSTDAENDKIKFGHLIVKETPTVITNSITTPIFGGTFDIPQFTADEAGHITAASNQTITIPKGSYTSATAVTNATEVITGISFTPSTGEIKSTKADSSTLKLNAYEAGNKVDDITNGDTYNTAFAKLQNQIHAEEGVRANAISALEKSLNEFKTSFDTFKISNTEAINTAKEAAVTAANGYSDEVIAAAETRLATKVTEEVASGCQAFLEEYNFDEQSAVAAANQYTDEKLNISIPSGEEETITGLQEVINALLERIEKLENPEVNEEEEEIPVE